MTEPRTVVFWSSASPTGLVHEAILRADAWLTAHSGESGSSGSTPEP